MVPLFPSGKSGLLIPKQEPFDAHGLHWLWGCQSQLLKCKQEETHLSHHSAPFADIALKDTFFGLCCSLGYAAWRPSWFTHTKAGWQRMGQSPSAATGMMAALYKPLCNYMDCCWDNSNVTHRWILPDSCSYHLPQYCLPLCAGILLTGEGNRILMIGEEWANGPTVMLIWKDAALGEGRGLCTYMWWLPSSIPKTEPNQTDPSLRSSPHRETQEGSPHSHEACVFCNGNFPFVEPCLDHCLVLLSKSSAMTVRRCSTQIPGTGWVGVKLLFQQCCPWDYHADMEGSHQAQSHGPLWRILSTSLPLALSPPGCILHPHKQTREHLINTSALRCKHTGPAPGTGFLLEEDKMKEEEFKHHLALPEITVWDKAFIFYLSCWEVENNLLLGV